ncbi:MAG TPA: HEAT repeat domain-containing protein [Bryobacteraceae bacterium]|nr:HEAT repeat domain-containing protein [Bryobacteraceae bacterium]
MKTIFLFLAMSALALHAQDANISRMLDGKLNISQRNDACYALRDVRSPEALAAFARALESPTVRACAARNLREAGAVDAFKSALAGSDPEIRAVAARELGAMTRPELMDVLAQTARDPNLMIATNAFEGLSHYQDRAVLPYLLNLADNGGLVAAMALSRAVAFADPSVLAVARRLMATKDVPLRLAALRAIGDLGDHSDLPELRQLAAKAESAAPAGRGFGLVPPLDLSRAAQNAIRQILSRS